MGPIVALASLGLAALADRANSTVRHVRYVIFYESDVIIDGDWQKVIDCVEIEGPEEFSKLLWFEDRFMEILEASDVGISGTDREKMNAFSFDDLVRWMRVYQADGSGLIDPKGRALWQHIGDAPTPPNYELLASLDELPLHLFEIGLPAIYTFKGMSPKHAWGRFQESDLYKHGTGVYGGALIGGVLVYQV